MKLGAKLVLWTTGVAGLAVPILGIFVYLAASQAVQEQIEYRGKQTTHHILNQIEQTLNGAMKDIQEIAASNVLSENLGRLASGLAADTVRMNNKIQEFVLLTGPWNVLYVVDTRGTVQGALVIAEKGMPNHHDPSCERAWNMALAGKVYASDVVMSEDTGKATVIFSAPIRDKEKKGRPIVGAVVGHFAWPVIMQFLDEVDPSCDTHLFDARGMLIGDRSVNRQKILKENLSSLPAIAQFMAKQRSPMVVVTRQTHRSEDFVLSCVMPSGDYLDWEGKKWGLLIEFPLGQMLEPVRRLAMRVAMISFALLFFMGVGFFFLGRRLMAPLERLSQTAKTFGAGDLGVRAEVKGSDEVSLLSQGFNAMAARIHEIVNDLRREVEARRKAQDELKNLNFRLEARVEERTEELAGANEELQAQMTELEQMNRIMFGREERILELKEEIRRIKGESPGETSGPEEKP